MSESRSFLEERIAIMAGDRGKWGTLTAAALGSLALALTAVASQVAPPNVGNPAGSDQGSLILTPAVLDRYVGFYVRGHHQVVSITRRGTQLLIRGEGFGPLQLAPDSQMRFASDGGSPLVIFGYDAQGQTTGFQENHGDPSSPDSFAVPYVRVDPSTAETILASNGARYRGQTATPGTAAMLRRIVNGLRTDNPNYDEMPAWFADLVRQTRPLNRPYTRMGAVQAIDFRGVDRNGGDVYEVRLERGVATWIVWVDSRGRLEDAHNWVW